MRPVLALSLVLLALTLLLNHAQELFPRAERARALEPLELLIGAKGPLLPQAFVGSGPERMGEAMRIGERTLVAPPGAAGLRAAILGPDFLLRDVRCFDVAASSRDVRELAERVADAGWGELLLLASSGVLEASGPEADTRRAELEALLRTLGARAHPGTSTPESWALIALCCEGGWVPLAEGYSRDSGVVLGFLVSPELGDYAEFQGDLTLVHAAPRAQVFLEEELTHASRRAAGTKLVRDMTVNGRPLAAILQRPLTAADGRSGSSSLVWRDVAVGGGSGFLAWVGLADGASQGSDGVAFEVRVDGQLAEGLTVLPGAPWRALEVDLRPFAGRSIELELVIDPRTTSTGDFALWGRPMVLHGYDGSPLEARPPER